MRRHPIVLRFAAFTPTLRTPLALAVSGLIALVPPVQAGSLGDYGDAPNGPIAYPSTGVLGNFPTCTTDAVGFVAHLAQRTEVHFGQSVDFETDGNGGVCAWPPYDNDECFGPPDAGLISPDSYTISGGAEMPCMPGGTRPLGLPCTTATWGPNIDIDVTNNWTSTMYVNVLIDWNGDGVWAGASTCGAAGTAEHVLVNFPIPPSFTGPISALSPPSFLIGPNEGFAWARFTIGEVPLAPGWNGAHVFDLGETEDYLLRIGATGGGVGVPNPGTSGKGLTLEPAYPNPFHARSMFAFTLDAPASVRLTIHDAAGRPVAVLIDGEQSAGRHPVIWDGRASGGRSLPAGAYFVRAQSGSMVRTMKLALVR